MLDKISLDDSIWASIDIMDTPTLLKKFLDNPDTSTSEFHQLLDCFWDAGTLKPAFFIAAPYLIDLSCQISFQEAKDIWCYLGCYSSVQEDFRNTISNIVLQKFDAALEYAAQIYPKILVENKHLIASDPAYLIPAQFSFIKHTFGRIALSNYFLEDNSGESLIFCSNHHENDMLIYNSGITHYGGKRANNDLPLGIITEFTKPKSDLILNSWQVFEEPLESLLKSDSLTKEIKSHIELSVSVIKNCLISTELPMRFTFSLCGCLFLWAGDTNLALRALHAWDYVTCTVCKETFCFADNWQG